MQLSSSSLTERRKYQFYFQFSILIFFYLFFHLICIFLFKMFNVLSNWVQTVWVDMEIQIHIQTHVCVSNCVNKFYWDLKHFELIQFCLRIFCLFIFFILNKMAVTRFDLSVTHSHGDLSFQTSSIPFRRCRCAHFYSCKYIQSEKPFKHFISEIFLFDIR